MWGEILEELQRQVTRPSYETWLRDTELIALKGNSAIVAAPNTLVAEMLEQRMYSLMVQAMARVTNNDAIELELVVLTDDYSPNEASHLTEIG